MQKNEALSSLILKCFKILLKAEEQSILNSYSNRKNRAS